MPNHEGYDSLINSIEGLLHSVDPKRKQDNLNKLENELKLHNLGSSNSTITSLLGKTFDLLAPMLNDSNHKICLSVLSCLDIIFDKAGSHLITQIQIFLPLVCEKLGDGKSPVREKAQDVIQTCMLSYSPHLSFERLETAFTHKIWRIKEQILISIIQTIKNFGPRSLPLLSIVNKIVKLLEDSNSNVRDAAVQALEEVYRYVGEELTDFLRERNIRSAQLNMIVERFSAIELSHERISLREKFIDPVLGVASKTAQKPPPSTNSTTSKTIPPSFVENNGNANGKIKPLTVYSEKELAKEFEKIAATLGSVDPEWNVRVDALVRITRLICGGATQMPGFTSLFHKIKEPLTVQLLDLRSQVMKESCNVLIMLADAVRESFEPFLEYFLPTLFKICVNAVNVIAETGHNCTRTVIKYTRSDRVIPFIIRQSGTHKSLRPKCAEYILLLMNELPTSSLDKHVDIIEDIIRKRTTDALPDVRSLSKQAFWVFCKHWPERANAFMNSLDSNVQKHLNEEKNKEEKKLGGSQKPALSKMVKSSSFEKEKPTSTLLPTNNAPLYHTMLNGKAEVSQSSSTSKATSNNLASKLSGVNSLSTTLGSATRVPIKKEASSSAPSILKVARASEDIKQPARSVPTSVVQASITKKAEPPQRVIRDKEPTSSYSLSAAGPRRVVAQQTNVKHTTAEQRETSSSTATHLGVILDKANSSLWMSRRECFTDLKGLAESKNQDILNHLEKVITLHVDHLADSHHQVLQQCLVSLATFIDQHPSQMEPYIERIMPNLLKSVSDSKDNIRNLAVSVMDTILENYGIESVMTILFKILDQPNTKLKVTCLEQITQMLPAAGGYFSVNSHMKIALQKSLMYINDKNSTVKKAGQTLLTELYSAFKMDFLTNVMTLPIGFQLEARRALSLHVPEIDNELLGKKRSSAPVEDIDTSDQASDDQQQSSYSYGDEEEESLNIPSVASFSSGAIIDNVSISQLSSIASSRPLSLGTMGASLHVNPAWVTTTNTHLKGEELFLSYWDKREASPKEFLHKVIDFSRGNNKDIWSSYFTRTINFLVQTFKHSDPRVRELALMTLNEILKNQPHNLFDDYVEVVVSNVIDSCNDSSRDVSQAADEIIDTLNTVFDAKRILPIIVPMFSKKGTGDLILRSTIRILGKFIPSMQPAFILQNLEVILPGLFEAFKSPNADVRKAVVFCLVDIYFLLGEDFTPYLAQLSPTQVKLIQIYCNKRRSQMAGSQPAVSVQ